MWKRLIDIYNMFFRHAFSNFTSFRWFCTTKTFLLRVRMFCLCCCCFRHSYSWYYQVACQIIFFYTYICLCIIFILASGNRKRFHIFIEMCWMECSTNVFRWTEWYLYYMKYEYILNHFCFEAETNKFDCLFDLAHQIATSIWMTFPRINCDLAKRNKVEIDN